MILQGFFVCKNSLLLRLIIIIIIIVLGLLWSVRMRMRMKMTHVLGTAAGLGIALFLKKTGPKKVTPKVRGRGKKAAVSRAA